MSPLAVEVVSIDSIVVDPDNAKIHTPEQISAICESIKSYSFNDPVGICGNMIVEGEGRWLAMKQLGETQIPVIRLDHLSEAQRRAYAMAHNHLNAKTGLDPLKLKLNLTAIKVAGLELKPIGFTPIELKKIFADPKKEADDAEDALEEAERQDFVPFAKLGDLWCLNEHRVLCGDSTKMEDVLRAMDGKTADMVLTDPPYNVAYVGKTADALTIANDKMNNEQFREFLFKFYKAAFDITKPGGAIYVFHADSEGYNFRGALVDAGWMMKQCLIWLKNAMVMGRQDYQWKHEPIAYGWKPGAAHTWNNDRCQTTILEFNRPSRSPDHPTPKTVAMLEYMITNSSLNGQIVFDPFLGSGSTLIAAEQTGRICHGLELSDRYASVIVKRWHELTNLMPMVHRGGNTLTMAEAIDASQVQSLRK